MARLPRLPDLLTTANLCCGVGSVLLASQGQLTGACGLVFLAAVFDVFDGLAARALGGGSELGKQLDSLADMVSFGVAPAVIATIAPWPALQNILNAHRDFLVTPHADIFGQPIWASIGTALVIAIASCWRLAKFNIDTRQTTGFLGLPTPANALFWASLGFCSWGVGLFEGPLAHGLHKPISHFAQDPVLKLIGAVVLGMLMLSQLPLPSLKFKQKGWRGNEVIFLLIGAGAVLIALYGVLAVPLILILYLLSPIWGKLFKKPTSDPASTGSA